MSAQLLAAGSVRPLSAGSPPWPAPICPSAQALESFAFLKTKIHCCSGCKSLEQRAAAVQLAQPPLSQAKERDVRIPAPAQELSHKYRLPEPPGSHSEGRGTTKHRAAAVGSWQTALVKTQSRTTKGEPIQQLILGRAGQHMEAAALSCQMHGLCCPSHVPGRFAWLCRVLGQVEGSVTICVPQSPPHPSSHALGYLLAKCSILE